MDEELNEWVELNQVARAAVTHGWLWGMGAWENRRGYSALGRGIGGQRQADRSCMKLSPFFSFLNSLASFSQPPKYSPWPLVHLYSFLYPLAHL